jgi:hypothetical protein
MRIDTEEMRDMRTLISLMLALTLSGLVVAQSAKTEPAKAKKVSKQGAAAQTTAQATAASQPTIQPSAPTSGSGTPGHLGKWITSSFLGDSSITEDKSGNVGIGTPSGTSTLTVGGLIETLMGGIKFPDGSIQTRAATLNHDATLQGDGAGNPLGLAVPLIFAGSVDNGNGVITVTNIAAGAPAIFATGGNSSPSIGGGSGMISLGGSGTNAPGGVGIVGFGGNSSAGSGGTGGSLIGGVAANGGNGGDGLFAVGALGTGAGKKGGRGIIAIPGGGTASATTGLAGEFLGDVSISGNLSKGGGSFKIDHPVDPANKYLYHSFVESPDMMNIYNGVISLDAAGEAIVELPEWFSALNRDFRYLLTAIGAPGPTLYIAEEVSENHFKIAGGSPRMRVSWQVTGIRQDAWANAHRIPVEQEKSAGERGYYLHPELFGQPEQKGIQWARDPEAMQRIKEVREQNKPASAVKQ